MTLNFDSLDPETKRLADALQLLAGDVIDDDEWDEYFDLTAHQWAKFKEQGRQVRDDWRAVLAKDNGELANYLVHNWANQGDYPPEEAQRILKKWYDHLQPVWDSLETDDPPGDIQLEKYIYDH